MSYVSRLARLAPRDFCSRKSARINGERISPANPKLASAKVKEISTSPQQIRQQTAEKVHRVEQLRHNMS